MRFTVSGRGTRRAVDVECSRKLSAADLEEVATRVGCRTAGKTRPAARSASYRFVDVALPDIGALVVELLVADQRSRRTCSRHLEPAWAEEYAESLAVLRT